MCSYFCDLLASPGEEEAALPDLPPSVPLFDFMFTEVIIFEGAVFDSALLVADGPLDLESGDSFEPVFEGGLPSEALVVDLTASTFEPVPLAASPTFEPVCLAPSAIFELGGLAESTLEPVGLAASTLEPVGLAASNFEPVGLADSTLEPVFEPPAFEPTLDDLVLEIFEVTLGETAPAPFTADFIAESTFEPALEPAFESTLEPGLASPTFEPAFPSTLEPVLASTLELGLASPTFEPAFEPALEPMALPGLEGPSTMLLPPTFEVILLPGVEGPSTPEAILEPPCEEAPETMSERTTLPVFDPEGTLRMADPPWCEPAPEICEPKLEWRLDEPAPEWTLDSRDPVAESGPSSLLPAPEPAPAEMVDSTPLVPPPPPPVLKTEATLLLALLPAFELALEPTLEPTLLLSFLVLGTATGGGSTGGADGMQVAELSAAGGAGGGCSSAGGASSSGGFLSSTPEAFDFTLSSTMLA